MSFWLLFLPLRGRLASKVKESNSAISESPAEKFPLCWNHQHLSANASTLSIVVLIDFLIELRGAPMPSLELLEEKKKLNSLKTMLHQHSAPAAEALIER